MDAPLLIEADVRAWMGAYARAWTERDPDQIVELFTTTAHYQEWWFKPSLEGIDAIRNYWRVIVQKSQRDVAFEYDILAVRGSHAFVHWHASFTWLPINGIMELDAISQILFAPERGKTGQLLAQNWDEWIDIREIRHTKRKSRPEAALARFASYFFLPPTGAGLFMPAVAKTLGLAGGGGGA